MKPPSHYLIQHKLIKHRAVGYLWTSCHIITQRASPHHGSQVTTTCYYGTTVSLAMRGEVITLLNVTHRLLYFQLNDTLMTSLLNHNPFNYSPEIYYLRLFS